MEFKQIKGNEIEGHLDIFISDNNTEILIHGNSKGLKIVGRLDARGTGEFYSRYVPKDTETNTI